ncbi:MAG: transporter, partial [Chlamydiae bacterium]|nr:transporter [Chlamydiota bacterium]
MRSLKKLLRVICIFSSLIAFVSCTLYPRYERPSLESSDEWRDPLPTEDAVEISWWKQFQDPVLNGLIEEAMLANQDILAA